MAARPPLQVVPPRLPVRRRLRVVAGVDGSELSEGVLRWCAALATVAAVEVVAVHALEARTYPPEFRRPLPLAGDRSPVSWRDEIRARIDAEWCAPLHLPSVRRRVIVGDGRPARVLARAARHHGADLVVVGGRARAGVRLAELLRPGVAHGLTRCAPCPVVVVPGAGAVVPGAMPSLRRLLVGWDGGEAAARALRWAAGLATDLDAELVTARVIAAAGRPPAPAATTARRPRRVDEVAAGMDDEVAALGDRVPPRHRSAVLVGEPPAMLAALAESEAAGLVVLGVDGGRRPRRLRPGAVASLLTRSAPCAVALVAAGAAARDTGGEPDWRITDMTDDAERPRGVRFAAGTVVSPGEYRNVDTGATRYFDGTTPLPGGVNAASWQQVSDHHHPDSQPGASRTPAAETVSHPVRFAAGTVVSPGEYRNVDTGAVRYFDGNSPLPGGVNAASWQQVSDHHHPDPHPGAPRTPSAETVSHPVRFAAGTMVSPGEYRNVETGAVQYFDGTTPLPGGANSASWQQVSDHHHPQVPGRA